MFLNIAKKSVYLKQMIKVQDTRHAANNSSIGYPRINASVVVSANDVVRYLEIPKMELIGKANGKNEY